MSLPHRRVRLIAAVAAALTVLFIWGNSLLPEALSVAFSGKVSTALGGPSAESPVDSSAPDSSETVSSAPSSSPEEIARAGWYFRKAGHFTEFLIFGIELAVLAFLRGKRRGRKEAALFLGWHALFISLVDETLQLFNDRHSLIGDIWIDLGGFAVGCGAALLLAAAVDAGMRRTRRVGEKG